jgi:hypothetical protein
MGDDQEDEDRPAVELGEGDPVEGAPVARVASRLHWPIQKSRVDTLEGDATIRTPDGRRELSSVLEQIDTSYFDRRQTFVEAVRDAVGREAIPTAADDEQ